MLSFQAISQKWNKTVKIKTVHCLYLHLFFALSDLSWRGAGGGRRLRILQHYHRPGRGQPGDPHLQGHLGQPPGSQGDLHAGHPGLQVQAARRGQSPVLPGAGNKEGNSGEVLIFCIHSINIQLIVRGLFNWNRKLMTSIADRPVKWWHVLQ